MNKALIAVRKACIIARVHTVAYAEKLATPDSKCHPDGMQLFLLTSVMVPPPRVYFIILGTGIIS
jgi:hypothetical protein